MKKSIVNKILRGTFGRLWINGRHVANVKEFELKVTLNYETVQENGNMIDQNRYIGASVAGNLLCHKTDSYFADLLGDAIKSGQMPDVKMDGRLDDPDADGSERIAVYDIVFDELTLLKFTNGAIGEEAMPFKAGDFEILDKIA